MEQRISLITLAVADLARAQAFYEALGWQPVETPPGIAAFDLIGQTLGLFPVSSLPEEIGLAPAPLNETQFSGIILSHNLRERVEVSQLMERAKCAGARIVKPPQDTAWGGYHGHFADPDGHVWEVAVNPASPLGPDGAFQWNGVQ